MTAEVPALDELAALLEKATPAPWEAGDYDGETSFGVHGGGPESPHDYNVCEIAWWCGADKGREVNKADGYLIAAARNALPELIKIAQAVATLSESYNADLWCICGALRNGSYGDAVEPHKSYCAWVLARKLAGGAP